MKRTFAALAALVLLTTAPAFAGTYETVRNREFVTVDRAGRPASVRFVGLDADAKAGILIVARREIGQDGNAVTTTALAHWSENFEGLVDVAGRLFTPPVPGTGWMYEIDPDAQVLETSTSRAAE